MNMKGINLSLALALFMVITVSCNSQNSNNQEPLNEELPTVYDSVAVQLNNKATELLFLSQNEDSVLSLAKSYLQQSIELDSNYYLAYGNLASVLIKQNQRDSAIKILQIIVDKRESYAEGLSTQGFIYEKSGEYDSANLKYRLALEAYDNRIKKDTSNVNAMANKAFLITLLHGKEVGFKEIEKVAEKYPEDPFVKMMKDDLIPFFDKEEFLSNY